MNTLWFRNARPLFFENARLFDPVEGEQHGSLRLAHGRIAGVNVAPRRGDARFDLDGSLVLPGLVNAHDHLELNNFPRWKNRPCYANAREWAAQANAILDSEPAIAAARAVPLADRLFIGGLKNLLAGATTVAHHNPFHPPLRARDFPVRVVRRYRWSHSLYLSPGWASAYRRTPPKTPFIIHLAEGTDDDARADLPTLSAGGALGENTVMIHGVGLTPAQRGEAIARGAALVWCPGSNFFLLESTAQVGEFARAGKLALGSDSRLTGERDLLDELAVASETRQLDAPTLLRAVTSDAARILRLPGVGRLYAGAPADLLVLPATTAPPLAALLQARRAGLRAVIRGGEVMIADPDLTRLIPQVAAATLDGRPKVVAPAISARYARCSIREPGFQPG
jgi:cytosine/adenosine deaminase-related metal-dependent hydrolase